jgi:hypothetical protein
MVSSTPEQFEDMSQPKSIDPLREQVISDEDVEAMVAQFVLTDEGVELKQKLSKGVIGEAQYLQLVIEGAMKLQRKQ